MEPAVGAGGAGEAVRGTPAGSARRLCFNWPVMETAGWSDKSGFHPDQYPSSTGSQLLRSSSCRKAQVLHLDWADWRSEVRGQRSGMSIRIFLTLAFLNTVFFFFFFFFLNCSATKLPSVVVQYLDIDGNFVSLLFLILSPTCFLIVCLVFLVVLSLSLSSVTRRLPALPARLPRLCSPQLIHFSSRDRFHLCRSDIPAGLRR